MRWLPDEIGIGERVLGAVGGCRYDDPQTMGRKEAPVTDDDHRIRLRLSGSHTREGTIEFDALVAFGDAFRRALRSAARASKGLPAALTGAPTTADQEASAIRLVGLSSGSTVLEFAPTDTRLFTSPAQEAIDGLVERYTAGSLDPVTTKALADSVAALGTGGSIGVERAGRDQVTINESGLAVGEQAPPPEPPSAEHVVDGWLHAVDLSPEQVRVRDAAGKDWRCDFDTGLVPMVVRLLDKQVRVRGIRSAESAARLRVTALEPLAPGGVELARSGQSADEVLEHAFVAAGIVGPQPLNELDGHVDPEDPEVLAFVAALQDFE